MAWCLIKSEEAKFRRALLDKKIDPFALADMSSEQRRALFSQFVDTENAQYINSLYEGKLLLKNQVAGFKSWAKQALGMNPKTRRDMIAKIENLQEKGVLDPKEMKDFKEDLVRTKLGLGITFEEAKTINQLAEESANARTSWEKKLKANPKWSENPNATKKEWKNDAQRMDFGLKQVAVEKYVNNIKLEAKKQNVSFREDPVRALLNPIKNSPVFINDLFKSLMATFDNSFFGRQGIKALYGNMEQKKIWANTLKDSFKNISAELQKKNINGFEPMDLIRADIYSRPNAMNNKYKVGGYELSVLHEEAIPTSLPQKIPGLGRVFTAAETAFNGSALEMRADLADMFIAKAEEQGLNMLDPAEARGVGNLIGSMTGRGNLGELSPLAGKLNMVLWSARFFKANIDTITAHQFDSKATPFTKAQARQNLLSIVGHVGALTLLAGLLDPDSVDPDPRSTNFGKIKVFGKWVDITGGLRTIAITAAHLVPSFHNGEWGVWKKSSTGGWTNLTAGGFGAQTAVDAFLDSVLLNKLGPLASIMRDYYAGEMFGGEPFNITKSIINSATPLSIQQVSDVKDEGFVPAFGVAIAEFFGLGVDTYEYKGNWTSKDSEEMKGFLEQVGAEKFKRANDSYDLAYNVWFREVQKDKKYKALSDDGKKELQASAKSAIKDKILKEYGYFKKKNVKTLQERKESITKKQLLP